MQLLNLILLWARVNTNSDILDKETSTKPQNHPKGKSYLTILV